MLSQGKKLKGSVCSKLHLRPMKSDSSNLLNPQPLLSQCVPLILKRTRSRRSCRPAASISAAVSGGRHPSGSAWNRCKQAFRGGTWTSVHGSLAAARFSLSKAGVAMSITADRKVEVYESKRSKIAECLSQNGYGNSLFLID